MLSLMIMRHGKSDWEARAIDDHDRPLNPRGVASAERMGEVIRDLGIDPDLVISSTARRARATAELARITGGWHSRLVLEEALYGTSVKTAIDVLGRLGGDASRIMLVGHQPAWSLLVAHLTGARCAMRTATVADIELDGDDWATIREGTGTLGTLLQARTFLSD